MTLIAKIEIPDNLIIDYLHAIRANNVQAIYDARMEIICNCFDLNSIGDTNTHLMCLLNQQLNFTPEECHRSHQYPKRDHPLD